jgi:hypothetical protein
VWVDCTIAPMNKRRRVALKKRRKTREKAKIKARAARTATGRRGA